MKFSIISILLLVCTVYSVYSADDPCGCTYTGPAFAIGESTANLTAAEISAICTAGLTQLECYRNCADATQAQIDLLSQIATSMQCGAAQHVISVVAVMAAVVFAKVSS